MGLLEQSRRSICISAISRRRYVNDNFGVIVMYLGERKQFRHVVVRAQKCMFDSLVCARSLFVTRSGTVSSGAQIPHADESYAGNDPRRRYIM